MIPVVFIAAAVARMTAARQGATAVQDSTSTAFPLRNPLKVLLPCGAGVPTTLMTSIGAATADVGSTWATDAVARGGSIVILAARFARCLSLAIDRCRRAVQVADPTDAGHPGPAAAPILGGVAAPKRHRANTIVVDAGKRSELLVWCAVHRPVDGVGFVLATQRT